MSDNNIVKIFKTGKIPHDSYTEEYIILFSGIELNGIIDYRMYTITRVIYDNDVTTYKSHLYPYNVSENDDLFLYYKNRYTEVDESFKTVFWMLWDHNYHTEDLLRDIAIMHKYGFRLELFHKLNKFDKYIANFIKEPDTKIWPKIFLYNL